MQNEMGSDENGITHDHVLCEANYVRRASKYFAFCSSHFNFFNNEWGAVALYARRAGQASLQVTETWRSRLRYKARRSNVAEVARRELALNACYLP